MWVSSRKLDAGKVLKTYLTTTQGITKADIEDALENCGLLHLEIAKKVVRKWNKLNSKNKIT